MIPSTRARCVERQASALASYVMHFAIGLGGAFSARCALGVCEHTSHRLIVGGLLLAIESVASVQLVG